MDLILVLVLAAALIVVGGAINANAGLSPGGEGGRMVGGIIAVGTVGWLLIELVRWVLA